MHPTKQETRCRNLAFKDWALLWLLRLDLDVVFSFSGPLGSGLAHVLDGHGESRAERRKVKATPTKENFTQKKTGSGLWRFWEQKTLGIILNVKVCEEQWSIGAVRGVFCKPRMIFCCGWANNKWIQSSFLLRQNKTINFISKENIFFNFSSN